MRVLLLCDWFLKVVEGQARGLRENGAEVALGYRDHPREYGGDPAEHAAVLRRLHDNGVQLVPLSGARKDLRAARGFMRRAHAWRPDVVHAHQSYDPRLLVTAMALRRPIVYTVHDPVPHPGAVGRSRLERLINAGWLRRADTVVVHGESLIPELRLPPTRRVRVVEHGIPVAGEPFPAPTERRLLFFGRLEPYKGIDVLLAAMERVWAARPEVTVTIRGSGSLKVTAPEDERVVVDRSYVPESEIDPMFAGATLTVLPYVQGSQTGVGIQSVARGVPVVVTDVGALRDVADGTGAIVAPGDPAALAGGILRLLDHDAALRARVHRDAVERFGWTAVAHRYLDVYAESLGCRVQRPTRVMLLCPELGTGGAERHWDGLAPELAVYGQQARVITFSGRGAFYESLERRGVPCTDLSAARPLWLPRVLAEARWRPDVVVTRAHNAHLAGSMVAALAGARHVLNWHRQPGKPMTSRQAWIMRWCAWRGDLVIAVSDSQLDELRGFGFADDRLEVIPNGVPPAVASIDRATLRGQRGVGEQELLAVAVGRLAPEKRFDLFVEAIAEARRRGVDAAGWIIGDGELRRELAAQIARLDVPVRLLGQREDVADHLLAADVLCVTSDFEALPMVILEALAAGLPVITTRVGGNVEAIRDGVEGLLVAPGDAAGVAQALERMAHPARRAPFGEAARIRHAENYDLKTMAARYASALEAASRRDGRPARASVSPGSH